MSSTPAPPSPEGRGTMFAPDENIARALLHAERRDPDAPALRSGTEVITHGELDAAILAASALLAAHGVAPGDRVGLIVPNVPQFAVLYHAVFAAAAIVEAAGFSATTGALGALPLSHSFGQSWLLNATLRAGGSVSLLASFDAGRALATIDEHQITFFAGVPTMFAKMLEVQKRTDTISLELCVPGGAAMAHELMGAFEATFGCEIREGYGLSETSPLVTLNPPGTARQPGSDGPAIPGVEVKAGADDGAELDPGQVGEILVRGHNVMKGYCGRPQETARAITEDGWFRTGDLGYVDLDGYLYISGRKKDLIIRGGYNVYPREVEEVLLEHPDVAEAAVLGIPHPQLAEEVAAAVRLREGADCTVEDLRLYARERLAAFKYPRRIWTVEALPTGSTGKVLKRLIEVPAEPIHAVSTPVPQGDRRNQ